MFPQKHLAVQFISLALIWTLLLAIALFYNLNKQEQTVFSFAKSEADVLIQHMKAARHWNAAHGGVYMEITEKEGPNPYLKDPMNERDIQTPSGKKLTLVNPAYMTRLINEHFNASDKRVAHITSLKPVRPGNSPDQWESQALHAFQKGIVEVSEISEINGLPYMRLMRPLMTKQECLQCHESQGYKLGDIRGGITASIPFSKHAAYISDIYLKDSLIYTLIWIFGLSGLFFAHRSFSSSARKLKKTEEHLNILSSSVQQASEAIMIANKDGIIEYVNPSFEKLTGYSAKEVLGKSPNMLKSGVQDSVFYENMWLELNAGHSWQGRIIDQKKDGTNYPAILTISPIKNEAGEITHYVGSQQDMREYESLEKQFHHAQKMEALGTLVGGIAHDFNNSLAAISGNAYLAKMSVPANSDAIPMLDTIVNMSFRSAEMIKQLLSFSRKDMKSMNPMLLAPFLKETFKIHKVSIPENITLNLTIDDDTLQVLGDINLLQQVILNIMNNARDAVEEIAEPLITVNLSRFEADKDFLKKNPELKGKSFACISIRDNGAGIKEENLSHIFDPFFSTKEVGKGTGLGLSMAYGAIHSHGGVISANSTLNQGTEISIWLPLLGSEQTDTQLTPKEQSIYKGSETILVVDDEASVLEITHAVLKKLGYQVIIAKNGQEALTIYQDKHDEIDLLIMDVVMPVLGGIEAAAAIREINPDARIIFATGYDRSHSLKRKGSDLPETVIPKPFSVSDLSQLIRKVLDGEN